MKIRLDQIANQGLDVQEELSVDWLAETLASDEGACAPTAPGFLSVHMLLADQGVVHVQGSVKAPLQAPCSRCLEPVGLLVEAPIHVALFPEGKEPQASDDGELREDDLGSGTYRDDIIDMRDVVRDEVFLELPNHPLCNEDCAGLCPQCGENRNQASCSCEAPIDPRWAALKNVKLNKSEH